MIFKVVVGNIILWSILGLLGLAILIFGYKSLIILIGILGLCGVGGMLGSLLFDTDLSNIPPPWKPGDPPPPTHPIEDDLRGF